MVEGCAGNKYVVSMGGHPTSSSPTLYRPPARLHPAPRPPLPLCCRPCSQTTTHVINSAIVKASKLTRATKVYRGLAGGALPKSFLTPNKQGVRGGIENAFLSTTFDRAVAMQYASSNEGKPAIVFEIQMGMIDRGAELQWVSQYIMALELSAL